MNFRDALKWGLYDRVLAALSLAVGLGIAVGALWIGTGEWFLQAITGNTSGGPSGTNLAIAAGGVLLGLFVWQLGKTAARHRTIVSATEQRVHQRLAGFDAGDAEARLAQIESDVEEVRRVASRLEQAMGQGDGATGGADAGAAGASSGAAAETSAAAGGAAGTEGAAAATADASDAADADGGVEFSEDEASAGADDAAAQQAASTADGGTTDDDAFEWAEDDDEGEYYRDA